MLLHAYLLVRDGCSKSFSAVRTPLTWINASQSH